MTQTRNLLIIAWLCLLSFTSWSQAPQKSIATAPEKLLGMQDWFLSTGNWQNDPQVYVREIGTGSETVIMLHGGWGAEHSGLIQAITGLEDQYRFIFYDQRGSLRSPFPDSLITFNHHIEDIELLRQELALDQLTIVGHSMGSVLASAYATEYPQHIKKLILLAPAYLKNPIPQEDLKLKELQDQELQKFLTRPEVVEELEKYGLNRASPPFSSREETSKFRINFGKRMLYDISKWSLLTGGRAIYKGHVFGLTANTYPDSGWDYIEAFKNNSYPVAIIAGDHDWLDLSNLLIKKWTRDQPEIKLSTIKNAGHIMWIDQPNTFAEALRLHLME